MYRLSEIAAICGAELHGKTDHRISRFMFDSRSAQSPAETLFVALSTGRNSGHKFIPDLTRRGFTSFLITRGDVEPKDMDADHSYLVSDDSLGALQALAAHHRRQFSIPVIGITGSNGKTVVKEWLYQLLKEDHAVCRSPKSYNSQVGVPLSILQLQPYHTLAIFEAGISAPGEMARISPLINPGIGIFTSFGTAHDEGFTNSETKLSEKLLLFRGSRLNVFNHVSLGGLPAPSGENHFIGGEDAGWEYTSSKGRVTVRRGDVKLDLRVPFADEASCRNAATCAVTMVLLGYRKEIVEARIKRLQPVALRLEIKNGIHNSLIINDFYNSDLDSLQIALDYLTQQSRRKKKVLILSDIEQSGLPAESLYARVSELVGIHRIDLLLAVGRGISEMPREYSIPVLFFESTAELVSRFREFEQSLAESTILLKGARSFGFEAVSRLLQQKSHDTVFEIDLNKLTANVNHYRSLLKPGVRLMCMVKAMGYGSGGPEIARTLQHIGVNYLAVAYADEGVELRQSQVKLPVMVMNPEEDGFVDMIMHQLEPEIYSMRVLESFTAELDRQGNAEPYPVHIKIDTGMNRLGFSENDLPQLVAALEKHRQVRVQSVFSHLVASEDPAQDTFTREQLRIFSKSCELIEKTIGYSFIRHICNSAGISRFPEAHFDMVRLGIGMYGVGTSRKEQDRLLTVGRLRTRISQVRDLNAGETVGYGRKGKVQRDTKIAVIPIGYADGFSRTLGNGAHGVYVNGMFCRTMGNICMDMCMVDVTGTECAEGDEAVIFETHEQLLALARALGTIPYEVLTNVSARVKRVYTQE